MSDVTYLALADSLAEQIADMAPGARLPSENELIAEHGLSRITARAALSELEQRHLVRRTRGSGTFVALRLPYPVRAGMPPSWSEIVRAAGHRPEYRYQQIGRQRANSEVARHLLVPRGRTVIEVSRVASIDGLVAAVQTHWLPADLFGDLDQHLPQLGSLATTLRSVYGIDSDRWWARADLDTVPGDVAETLELVGRPPAWHIESVNRCRSLERPVEFASGWMRADSFKVVLEWGPTDGITP